MIKLLPAFVAVLFTTMSFGQSKRDITDSLKNQTDVKDVVHFVFNGRGGTDTVIKKHSNWSVLPSASYNPSVGFAMGLITVGGKTFGNPDSTTLSVVYLGAYVSTGGLSTFEFKHNAFSSKNKWNLQGRWEVGKTVAIDNGIGTGSRSQSDGTFTLNDLVLDENKSDFPISYMYIKFSERIYRKISDHVYVGAGLSFVVFNDITEPGKKNEFMSHNYRYSVRNGFSPTGYSANGLLFNIQYNTRDQPNRAFNGIYADVILKADQTWLGSEHVAEQLKIEFRKYWSLSKKNPETVLAFWHWSNFLLGGKIPYLDLPGTGSDTYGRSGRAYVIGRFKGLSFMYDELELRVPLTQNKLLSAVTFINTETGNNQRNVSLYKFWETGGGVGLRLLFNKYTRSNLCIDYGRGSYGNRGVFIGINEVF